MTSRGHIVTCEWCGQPFEPSPAGRGPTPKYCCRSHRQRAYEARQSATADLHELAEVLAATRAEVARATTWAALTAAYHRLAAATGQLLGEASASPTPLPPHGPADAKAAAHPTLEPLHDPALLNSEAVTVTRNRPGRRPPKTRPEHPKALESAAITLKNLSPAQVNAAAHAGATTTKTTATFVGDPAIILDRIQWAGAAQKAQMIRSGRKHRAHSLAASFKHLAAKFEAATRSPATSPDHHSQTTSRGIDR